MPDWWLSSERMTVHVAVDEQGKIVETAPVVQRFIGQPLENLRRWMMRHGEQFRMERLD